ncbi:MAG: hypothetical protein M1839_005794, partial [Geoglossum umbratile]
ILAAPETNYNLKSPTIPRAIALPASDAVQPSAGTAGGFKPSAVPTASVGFSRSGGDGLRSADFYPAAWADCVIGLRAGSGEEEEGDDVGELHACNWKLEEVQGLQ